MYSNNIIITIVYCISITIHITVAGCKPISVCWLHGKEEIPDNSKIYSMEREGAVHRLIISEVFPEDGGVYLVEAFNEYGEAATSCVLTVQGEGSRDIMCTHCTR